jgi:hypothetical protein
MSRKLIIDGTYRHYKGGLYTALGTLTPRQYLGKDMVLRTELYGDLLCASDILANEDAVVYTVYKSDSSTKFLREKSNFLAVLGKPTSQYYRFEEVLNNG